MKNTNKNNLKKLLQNAKDSLFMNKDIGMLYSVNNNKISTLRSKINSKIEKNTQKNGINKKFSTAFPEILKKSREPEMFCHQCAQTRDGLYCDIDSVCGKTVDQSKLQALLLTINQTVASYINLLNENDNDYDTTVFSRYLLETSFSTLTNVNFDETQTMNYIEKLDTMKKELKARASSKGIKVPDSITVTEFVYKRDLEYLTAEGKKHAIWNRFMQDPDADAFSLKELIRYGIKGVSAYFCHAERLRDFSVENKLGDIPDYSETERKSIYDGINKAWCTITSPLSVDELFGHSLELGAVNLKVMKLLYNAHTHILGVPEPNTIPTVPVPGKSIIVSGHDMLDLKILLEMTKDKNINIYTHGEMAPGHSYPELKKHKHFIGHLGTAWYNQQKDFTKFRGAILLTSNCLMPPKKKYADRLFTTNSVGFKDIPHLNTEKEFEQIIKRAQEVEGFTEDYIKEHYPKETCKDMTVGFGHQVILSLADTVIGAINEGKLKNIFLIGGCDGFEKKRDYFSTLTGITPQDSLVLTMGCAKFKVNENNLGNLGDSGIPRILDMGQCNDSYSAVVVALELSKALGTGVNDLPLHLAVSWFEQKAVAVLLTLLHLNIKNIRLGPIPPAFLTPNIIKVLNEKFNLQVADHKNPQGDLDKMIKEKEPKH